MLSFDTVGKREYVAYPLDEALYSLDGQEAAFFKSQTGIEDDEELKRHILRSQKEAYEVRMSRYYSIARALSAMCNSLLGVSVPCTPVVHVCKARPIPTRVLIYLRTMLTWTPPSGFRSPAIGSTRTSCGWGRRGLERSSSKWRPAASGFPSPNTNARPILRRANCTQSAPT